jgi:branched-chain amino acid transport system permease protein
MSTRAPSGSTSRTKGPSFRDRVTGMPKWVKVVLWVILALLLYLLPILNPPILSTPDTDFGGVLLTVTLYVLVALGLNIVVGYAGLLDLGYVGFYAVGAYGIAVLTSQQANWPYLLALPVAILAALVSGVILGAPTLRVRGDYLAIVTLGFGEIIRLVAVNSEPLGEAAGIPGIAKPPSIDLFDVPHLTWDGGIASVDLDDTTTFLEFSVVDLIPFYWLTLTVVFLVIWADIRIKDSRVGRAWEACREDEDAAELMGVPTFRFKLLAFAMGAFVGGLSGALYAGKQGFISPNSFLLLFSILFLASVVVGGQGNRWGVIVGAALVAYLPERFRDFTEWRVLVFGLALMLLATFRPQGLLPPRRTVRSRKVEEELDALAEGEATRG